MKTSHKLSGFAVIVILSLFAFKYPPQENQLLKNIVSKLLIYNKNEGPEKTYVHTDKDFYTNGETIWFKTYLIDGITHTQSDKSRVVYVELVNARDSVIERRKLYTNVLGAAGDIELDKNIPQGTYKLRAYTKYMLNDKEPVFFQKDIPIVVQRIRGNANVEDYTGTNLNNRSSDNFKNADVSTVRPTIRFFPEGGHLVKGLGSTLGLEVTDSKGNGIQLKGHIKDDKGSTIVPFESHEFGLGKVNFKPDPNTMYYASVEIEGKEQKYPLPKANDKGYVLSIKNRGDHMILQVAGNTENGVRGTVLIGHLRGKLIFKRIGKSEDRESYAFGFSMKNCSMGWPSSRFSPLTASLCAKGWCLSTTRTMIWNSISIQKEQIMVFATKLIWI